MWSFLSEGTSIPGHAGQTRKSASPLPVPPPTATFVPVSSPMLLPAQHFPSLGSAKFLGQAPDGMGQDGTWPAEKRELSCAGKGNSGSKGIVSGRPCGRNMGRAPGVRLEGLAETGPWSMLECQVEGLDCLSDGNRGQTVQGMRSEEAVGFYISFTFSSIRRMFVEHLACARHSARLREASREGAKHPYRVWHL